MEEQEEPDQGGKGKTEPGTDRAAEPLTRVCPKCSTQATATGEFCPHCGARYQRRRRLSRRAKIIAGVVVVLLVLGGAGTGVALKVQHDNDVKAQKQRDAAAAKDRADRQARADALTQQANSDRAAQRQRLVSSLQDEITKDARKRVDDGSLTGPIEKTVCTPIGGGNTDSPSAHTGAYTCLAVNKHNPDGTDEGYRFSATVNYDDGNVTWHLGG